jgi:hypothetical protein
VLGEENGAVRFCDAEGIEGELGTGDGIVVENVTGGMAVEDEISEGLSRGSMLGSGDKGELKDSCKLETVGCSVVRMTKGSSLRLFT